MKVFPSSSYASAAVVLHQLQRRQQQQSRKILIRQLQQQQQRQYNIDNHNNNYNNNYNTNFCATTSTNIIRYHYSYAGPGSYETNLYELWKQRDFINQRGFTVGIGGPVGSGKTALVLALCKELDKIQQNTNNELQIGVVTNDIFTQEDADFLIKHNALSDTSYIRAVETGGCPHAAIREDISSNLYALEDITKQHYNSNNNNKPLLLLCESGGDNLAANFSRELADLILYVIDVAGGDKVPRKGGPGITQSDLLIINKIDLAEAVGSDLHVMEHDANTMRTNSNAVIGKTILASIKQGIGLSEICNFILTNFNHAMKQQQ